MILDDFERNEKILIDLLKLLREGMHFNIYFKIHEKLIGGDDRIYKFQIRRKQKVTIIKLHNIIKRESLSS